MKRNTITAILLLSALTVASVSTDSFVWAEESGKTEKIGISMHSSNSKRWERDGEALKKALTEFGYDVELTFTAGGDQSRQIDDLLSQDIKVLVVTADDPSGIGPALEKASEQGIKILAYDRMPVNTSAVDALVTFDSRQVGRLQGEYVMGILESAEKGNPDRPAQISILSGNRTDPNAVWVLEGQLEALSPYIEDGTVAVPGTEEELLGDSWSAESGKERMTKFLDAGNKPAAVLCANDELLTGCMEAFQGRDELSDCIMTGQDAMVSIVAAIAGGRSHTATVFKDTRLLAEQAAEVADALAKGEVVLEPDDKLDNGTKEVAAYFSPVQLVTEENYRELLIDSGYYTEDEVLNVEENTNAGKQ